MCKHQCKCGVVWSHQDFPIRGEEVPVFGDCPWPQLYGPNGKLLYSETQACPSCYAEKSRWYTKIHQSHLWDKDNERCLRCGTEENIGKCYGKRVEKLSFKEMMQKVEETARTGKLSNERIAELQLDEEGIFNLLKVKDMPEQELEQHYNDLLEKMEAFRVRALRFRQLKTDYDIEEMSKVSDADRAEFEAAKQRRAAARKQPDVAAIRRSKQEKMVESFARRILNSNPNMTHEEAVERATKMFV